VKYERAGMNDSCGISEGGIMGIKKNKKKDKFQMERYAFMIIKLQVLVFYLPKFRLSIHFPIYKLHAM